MTAHALSPSYDLRRAGGQACQPGAAAVQAAGGSIQ